MSEYILEMCNISKTFPGVKALDHVNFQVREGEIHGLCGENGAGKSTLMKILSGVYPYGSYDGDVVMNGEVHRFNNIKSSENAGIAIIYQEFTLVKEMEVAENIFLGQEPTHAVVIDRLRMYSTAQRLLKDVGLDISVHEKAKNLGIGQQQLVEIAKALSKDAKVLILDEPTAALTNNEIDILMSILKKLKDRGITCIYISHKLSEVLKICDRVTVLRDGKSIATHSAGGLNEDRIIKMMVGREMKDRFPKENFTPGDVVFEVKNFSVYDTENNMRPIIKNAGFKVKKGEVLGISGLMGSGRTEMVMSILGAVKWKREGTLFLNGREVKINSAAEAIKLGIGYVSEDRKRYGLILSQSVKKNMSLAALDKFIKALIIDSNREIQGCNEMVKSLNLKVPSLETRVSNLSGGNQQKVVLAKWLLSDAKVLFLDEPTRGIDVGAKYEIYCIINELIRAGVAVVVISSELSEILGMCDRILVMNQGAINGEFMREEANQENIIACAVGGH